MARDDTKLLQAIIDGQKALEQRLSEKIDKVEKKVNENGNRLDKVNERLDLQGSQLAYLEDDAPTIKEFNRLERKVAKLEAVVYK